MKPSHILLLLIVFVFVAVNTSAQETANDYQPWPDSKAQPGVPKGEVLKFTFDQSKIFPGAWREY